jgi:environmental stress-induced protein Ves
MYFREYPPMTIARIIRAADCPEVPWKNGGGTTREIAVFPPGAGMDDFLWRLSMARVEQAGPFSSFEGIDRTLSVLEGTLHLSGAVDAVLDPVSAPFSFDGAANVDGVPLGGPVLDLNAMVRRGAYTCEMQRIASGETFTPAGMTFLLALEPQSLGHADLGYLDCAQIDGPATATGYAILVSFSSLAPSASTPP